MTNIQDRIAFFEEQVPSGNESEKSRSTSRSTFSLVESTESISRDKAGTNSTSPQLQGKKILFPGIEEHHTAGLSSKGSTDIWSMFSKASKEQQTVPITKHTRLPPVTNYSSTGQSNIVGNRNANASETNNSPGTGFYSRYNIESKPRDQKGPNDARRQFHPSGPVPSHSPNTLTEKYEGNRQDSLRSRSIKKLDSSLLEQFSTGVTTTAPKRSWAVANANSSSLDGTPSPRTTTQRHHPWEKSDHMPDERVTRSMAVSPRTATPRRKRLNTDQRKTLENVIEAKYTDQKSDVFNLPQQPLTGGPEKRFAAAAVGAAAGDGKSPEDKLSYAKRMHEGYLRSTGRGAFVPKKPNRWGDNEA